MRENDDRIPVVDDGTLFAVAAVLAAAVIDANPGYADEAKFEEAADQIREKTLGFLKTVRTMSGMGGKPLLHHMFKVAGVKDRKEHTSELQSLMRISYAVFCLKQKTAHEQIERKDCTIAVYTRHIEGHKHMVH